MPPASTRTIANVIASTVILLAVASSAGCSGGGGGGSQSDPALLAMPDANAVTRTSVAALLGTNDVSPVGITITPDTGKLVLLDSRQGVYELGGDRRFRRIADSVDLYGEAQPDSEFTDIAALGRDTFAITARNDGFLLDLADGSIRQHFCYVPGGLLPPGGGPWGLPEQLTESVAFDTRSGRILAQPVTIWNQVMVSSEIGTFPITGGEGTDWHPIGDNQFLAGGMTVDADGVFWLGRGADLCRYDLATEALTLEQTLTRFDITEIAGMVFDGEDLVVLDEPSATIVRIPAGLL